VNGFVPYSRPVLGSTTTVDSQPMAIPTYWDDYGNARPELVLVEALCYKPEGCGFDSR
jgi:hypothetical protein